MKRTEQLNRLKQIVTLLKEKEPGILNNINNNKTSHLHGVLAGNNFFYAMHAYFNERNIPKAKNLLSLIGQHKLQQAKLSKGRLFEVARTLISNVAISDNVELIRSYGDFNYPISYISRNKEIKTDYKTWVAEGEECIYSELMLNSMNKDLAKLNSNLEIFKSKTLKKKMNQRMNMDLEFYESLLLGDAKHIKISIEKFLTNKEHNYRNKHDLFPELLSYPAVGYCKIASLNGYEIKIDNHLIPNELINSLPLENYTKMQQIKVANSR